MLNVDLCSASLCLLLHICVSSRCVILSTGGGGHRKRIGMHQVSRMIKFASVILQDEAIMFVFLSFFLSLTETHTHTHTPAFLVGSSHPWITLQTNGGGKQRSVSRQLESVLSAQSEFHPAEGFLTETPLISSRPFAQLTCEEMHIACAVCESLHPSTHTCTCTCAHTLCLCVSACVPLNGVSCPLLAGCGCSLD